MAGRQKSVNHCPCGGASYASCCARFHSGEIAPNAEALMRSRYSAYVLKLETYLLATWHPGTCPATFDLAQDITQWIGLQVIRYISQSAETATVEFVARYKIHGRAQRLHEVSRFVFEDGRWLYVDGEMKNERY
ncbi:MAG: hypothetical protein HOP04_02800 [Methylophilaceae bacterium]|nr:hypothetical protein [Methylophilaceae bacterium]